MIAITTHVVQCIIRGTRTAACWRCHVFHQKDIIDGTHLYTVWSANAARRTNGAREHNFLHTPPTLFSVNWGLRGGLRINGGFINSSMAARRPRSITQQQKSCPCTAVSAESVRAFGFESKSYAETRADHCGYYCCALWSTPRRRNPHMVVCGLSRVYRVA